jgi:hypothetical protein
VDGETHQFNSWSGLMETLLEMIGPAVQRHRETPKQAR